MKYQNKLFPGVKVKEPRPVFDVLKYDGNNAEECLEFGGMAICRGLNSDLIIIGGDLIVTPSEWIIKLGPGKLRKCVGKFFEEFYEPVPTEVMAE